MSGGELEANSSRSAGVLLLLMLATFGMENRGKGRLILEESEEEARQHYGLQLRKGRSFVASVCVAFTALLAVFYYLYGLNPFVWMLLIFEVIFVTAAVLGLLYDSKTYRPQPLRVYENGLEFPTGSNRSVFYSFGEITKMKEVKMLAGAKQYWFYIDEEWPARYFTVRSDIEGLEGLMDDVGEKIGKPEYIVKVPPTDKEMALSKRHEENVYIVAFMLGLILTIALLVAVYSGLVGFSYLLIDLILMVPFLTIILLMLVTSEMMRSKLAPPKLNVKIPALMIIVLVLVVAVFVVAGDGFYEGALKPKENVEPVPGTSALAPGDYDHMNLDIKGNIVVRSGEILRVVESTIQFNLSADKQYGIWVEKGGTLLLYDSIIHTSSSYSYTFEIQGSATIFRSQVLDLWGDTTKKDSDGGLEIYSSKVRIDGSEIWGRTNGILVVNADPIIANSTIQYVKDEAIELRNSDAKILNNTLLHNALGIAVDVNSNPTIRGNEIGDNQRGIEVYMNSDPVIEENLIFGSRHEAFRIYDDCNPKLKNNVLVGNEEGTHTVPSLFAGTLCVTWTGFSAAICLLFLQYLYWKGGRREVELMGASPTVKKLKI